VLARTPRSACLLLYAGLLVACGGERPAGGSPQAHDAGTSARDAGDAAERDASTTSADAGVPRDAGVTVTTTCEIGATTIRCPFSTTEYRVGVTTLTDRRVHYAVPNAAPPAAGYPVVLFFQGSFFSSDRIWEAEAGDTFGAFELARTLADLLDRGYAIVAPEAHARGNTFWDTNVPPFSLAWSTSSDHRLMLRIFEGIEAGELGPLDPARLFATGISSGGYMTSRMAVSYGGRFTALAVHSASYATCSGTLCSVPELPSDHPPTLFLHGTEDRVTPIDEMEEYADALDTMGVDVRVVTASAGHEWIAPAVPALADWFDAY
jgi:dienelactone hydrolase